jgi:hypothetical protein
LVSLRLRSTCSKSLLLLLVIIFGLLGIKLIMRILYRMLLLLHLQSTKLFWNIILLGRLNWPFLVEYGSPLLRFLKINYNTTIRDTFSAQAAVCRDSRGSIIRCISLISFSCSHIHSEALAALLAARLAFSLSLSMATPLFFFENIQTDLHSGMITCCSANITYTFHNIYLIFKVTSNSRI